MNEFVPAEHLKRYLDALQPKLRVGSVRVGEAHATITGEWPVFDLHLSLPRPDHPPANPTSTLVNYGQGWIAPEVLRREPNRGAFIEHWLNEHQIAVLPPGTYELNGPVRIDDNQTLLGCSYLTTLKPAPGYQGHLIESKNYQNRCIYRARIGNLKLDGNATTNTAVRLAGRECILHDLLIQSCWTYGIHISGISSEASNGLALNNLVRDVRLFRGGTAKYQAGIMEDYYTADNVFFNCYVEYCRDACLETRGYNARIVACHLYESEKHGLVIRDSKEKIVSNCYLENFDGNGIVITGSNLGDTIIAGNIFRNIRRKTTTELPGEDTVIQWSSPPPNTTLTHNLVRRDNTSFRQVANWTSPGPVKTNLHNTWTDAVAEPNEISLTTRLITGHHTLQPFTHYIVYGGNATLTLPAGTTGMVISLARTVPGSTTLTLARTGTDLINGSASNLTLTGPGHTTLLFESPSVGWRTT